jgi:polyhydroxyalkanoate synthesis regulator phasin
MKNIVMKSIYAGLGLLGSGTETVKELGRELARHADLSEKEGEKLAKQLRSKSEQAMHSLRKTLETEVSKVVKAARSEFAMVTGRKPARTSSAPRRRKRRPKAIKAIKASTEAVQ